MGKLLIMKRGLIVFFVLTFMSFFVTQAFDNDCCPGSHHEEANHQSNTASDDGCRHLHTNGCMNIFFSQSVNKIDFSGTVVISFSESIYHAKPAPVLDGPFQPPRLS